MLEMQQIPKPLDTEDGVEHGHLAIDAGSVGKSCQSGIVAEILVHLVLA